MKLIYVDAVRDMPAGGLYDILCRNVDEALKYIRKEYKAGNTTFFIDMPGEDIWSYEAYQSKTSLSY